MPATHLNIRPARPDDRAAVVAMVATVWEGTDYIPKVWDDWLADADGPLLIGELDEQPVAVAKLSALAPGEDWFEGLRVDPQQRGKGIARDMLQHCVDLARERGARTLGYLTSGDNGTMHRIGAELGFRLVYAPRWYKAPPLPGGPEPIALSSDRLPALLEMLRSSLLLAQSGGLYSYGWTVYELNEARLRAHLDRGEVWAVPDASAWAIVVPSGRRSLGLAHIEGDIDAFEQLGRAVCARLRPELEGHVRALLPPDPACAEALAGAGFWDEDHEMHAYELPLLRSSSDDAGTPASGSG